MVVKSSEEEESTMKRYALFALLLAVTTAQAGVDPRRASRAAENLDQPVAGLIIKFKPQARAAAAAASTVRALSARTGVAFGKARMLANNATAYTARERLDLSSARAAAALLRQDPDVEYAEPDRFVRAQATNDPYWLLQWHYHSAAAVPGGTNLEGALGISRGAPAVVVAVLDTGLRTEHPDRPAQLVAGYDFVSAIAALQTTYGVSPAWFGADGDGRDADPSDPGTYVTQAELSALPAAFVNDFQLSTNHSSWHGTHVAGTIAARTDNAVGVAGIAGRTSVLPIRVLGKSGWGLTSDVIDAMHWAVGLPVPGVADNPNPARVLNLSLGSDGACSAAYQDAVAAVTAAGGIIVAATGNQSSAVGAPANCDGVVAVTAHGYDGDSAYYANVGPETALSAPGGGCGTLSYNFATRACNGRSDPVISTLNLGATTATTDDYGGMNGTSMATPHVAGVVALMLSLAPGLQPAEVRSVLQASARPHPPGSYCATLGAGQCGAGLLDAQAALQRVVASAPTVQAGPAQVVAPGSMVTLSGAANVQSGRLVTQWRWRQTSGPGDVLAASDRSAQSLSFAAPATGTYGFELSVTDSAGYVGVATTSVRVNSAPVVQPLPNLTGQTGQVLAVQAVASDADGDAVSFIAVQLPAAAVFDSRSGRMTWTPSTPGTAVFTVKATDGVAESAPVSATLTVTAPPSSETAGGGGAVPWLALVVLSGLALRRRRTR